ncbi:TonB-dependent receptor [Luteimonas sp. gir]|uniref:TonB-dependent receptor plug domain-containing protein n=1 Tax=Luteimonas sp. gir TaxID=3127960 RepID=UPI003075DB12
MLALAIATVVAVLCTPPVAAQQSRDRDPQKDDKQAEANATQLDTIQVTGTRIRGGTTPSPVVTIGIERIREEGFKDLGEVIRSIPQNFSGGQNPGMGAQANPSAGVSNQNVTGGSGLNLRGLGPDATLTLLNGRRLAYGGLMQMVDISAIPVDAVERLEIVPDGASALYGSDAVGGVGNVILKRDFDGVAAGWRFGAATDGGMTTREYTATTGTSWATGGMIVAGQKTDSDPIRADQRDYTLSMYQPATLWSGNRLRSAVASAHQALGDAAELRLDVLRSERTMVADTAYASVYHRYAPETTTTLVAPSLELHLPQDWTLTLGAALGRDKTVTTQQVIATATGAVNSTSAGTYSNKSVTYELGGEGPLFDLPGGESRLAVGAGYRYNRFLSLSLTGNRTNAEGDERSRFAYAELSLPLVGAGQGIRGAERLVLTSAVRTEDSDSYGRVTTPKLGVVYSPLPDVTLKASWGRSFKAPTFQQRYWQQNAYLYAPATFGGTGFPPDVTALYLSGGRVDLDPERARTWSTSLSFHPSSLPGLETELTWFDIDYIDRIVSPVIDTGRAFAPIYAAFVALDPSHSTLDGLIGGASNFYNYAGAPYDGSKVVAVVDNRYVNASRQRIRGLDLAGTYRLDVAGGRLSLRGSASWLDSTQATLATQPPHDLSGTLFNPARRNARLGAVWNRDGWTASVFGNYSSGVENPRDGSTGASFTTFDGTLRYDTGPRGGLFSEVTFELAGQNLLDRAPPLYASISPTYAPYDAANYSAVGRFLSVSITKRW